jgi:hypothetical protein
MILAVRHENTYIAHTIGGRMIKRYNYLKIHIKAELKSIETLYELAINPGTITNYEKIKIQNSEKKSPQEKFIIKISEIKNKVDQERDEMIDLYENIKYILSLLKEKDAYLIEQLDLNDKTLIQVADILKIKSLKYLSNKHYDARKNFRDLQNKMFDLKDGRYVVKSG